MLAAGGKFFQIDAAPWTPKFWGGIVEMLFGSIAKGSEVEVTLKTNPGQALQYLATLKRLAPRDAI